jgi:hypothetical protein
MYMKRITMSLAAIGGSYCSGYNIYSGYRSGKTVRETAKSGAYGMIFGTICGAGWPITLGYVVGTQLIDKPK